MGHSNPRLTATLYGKWLPVENPGAVGRLDDQHPRQSGSKTVAARPRCGLPSPQVVEGLGGPRRDRTGDLLIANEPEGESEKVPEGLNGPQTKKDEEDETG